MTHSHTGPAAAILAVALVLSGAFMATNSAESADADTITMGSVDTPLSSFNHTVYDIINADTTVYLALGSPVVIEGSYEYDEDPDTGPFTYDAHIKTVTPGYGLYIAGRDLRGSASTAGTVSATVAYDQIFAETPENDRHRIATVTFVIVDVPTITVSDLTVVAGSAVSFTPVTSGTVTVSGASWLTASGNLIYGTAPATPGTYNVTVSSGGQSASFTLTVISKLAPTNSPANGVISYVKG